MAPANSAELGPFPIRHKLRKLITLNGCAEVERLRNNMIVLCPNDHALVHFVETTFDWETLTFRIGKTDVPVALNHHLSGR